MPEGTEIIVNNEVDNVEVIVNLRGGFGTNGLDGEDGSAGPNIVSTETMTAFTGLIGGDGSFCIDVPISDNALSFVAAADYSAMRTAIGLGTGDSPTFVATNLTGTAAGLNAGSVTTNANLTGHVTSTGNAAVLGSFTKAQLDTAVSDGNLIYVGDAPTAHTHPTSAVVFSDSSRFFVRSTSGGGAGEEATTKAALTMLSDNVVTNASLSITLADSDSGTILRCTGATAITITVPSTLLAGFNLLVLQAGAGAITFTAGAGTTLNSFSALVKTAGQHAAASLLRTASATYNLSGNLSV